MFTCRSYRKYLVRRYLGRRLCTLRGVCKSYELIVADIVFGLYLIVVNMKSLDVILGMDWLSVNRTFIDCFRLRVLLNISVGNKCILRRCP